MSIEIKQVNVLDNPSSFTSPFKFEITFDCLAPGIANELEWKLVYVGSADDDSCDQELDSVLVGPVKVGKNRFVFQAPCADASKIPKGDLLDVTVLLLTCSYNGEEFIRVGYYVSNEYPNYNCDGKEPIPEDLDINKITRNILANKPRVTRFHIKWDDNEIDNNNNQNNSNNNNNNTSNNNNNEMDEKEKSGNNSMETPMLDSDDLAKVAHYQAYENAQGNDNNNNNAVMAEGEDAIGDIGAEDDDNEEEDEDMVMAN